LKLDYSLLPAHLGTGRAIPTPDRGRWRFVARWATSEAEVEAAQRLRYAIFAGELGAHLTPPPGTPAGCDADRFDPFCDHLLVWVESAADDAEEPRLVGTYRVLLPDGARRAGGYYADSEFDLAPLRPLLGQAIELGRACVHPDWRSGGVIMALWGALGAYMLRHRLQTMFGCASIGMADGGDYARRVWRRASDAHLAEPEWRIQPRHALALDGGREQAPLALAELPALLKGYLRCGAKVLGAPAYDAAFNTADLPIMMRLDELSPRYRKQFLAR
jgi:putative hemolysin